MTYPSGIATSCTHPLVLGPVNSCFLESFSGSLGDTEEGGGGGVVVVVGGAGDAGGAGEVDEGGAGEVEGETDEYLRFNVGVGVTNFVDEEDVPPGFLKAENRFWISNSIYNVYVYVVMFV